MFRRHKTVTIAWFNELLFFDITKQTGKLPDERSAELFRGSLKTFSQTGGAVQHIEPRLEEPPGTVHVAGLYSFGGDLLVTRRKGDTRQTNRQRQTARDLRLTSINDVCVVESIEARSAGKEGRDKASTFGKAVVIQHLLSFRRLPLPMPPGRFDDLWILEDGTMMLRENYGSAQAPGELVIVGAGEYIQAETSDGYLAVSWSSAHEPTAPASVFHAARAAFGPPVGSDSAALVQLDLVAGDGQEGVGTAAEVLEFVEHRQPAVTFMRTDYKGGARVSWSGPAQRVVGYGMDFCAVTVRLPVSAARQPIFDLLLQTCTAAPRVAWETAYGELKQLLA